MTITSNQPDIRTDAEAALSGSGARPGLVGGARDLLSGVRNRSDHSRPTGRRSLAASIHVDFATWREKHRKEAVEELELFRSRIEEAQVVLDHSVIDALRQMDSFFYQHLPEDWKPGEYARGLTHAVMRLN